MVCPLAALLPQGLILAERCAFAAQLQAPLLLVLVLVLEGSMQPRNPAAAFTPPPVQQAQALLWRASVMGCQDHAIAAAAPVAAVAAWQRVESRLLAAAAGQELS